jgi:2-polyprenyl-3-methyl-5-hydroxy-6-metoxy-1,4-benzoquinol methylase
MPRFHVPNLFVLVGQPDNGKTTLSKAMEAQLNCPVIHTDQVYQAWMQDKYPEHYKAAKANIRGHWPKLNSTQQREWNEHVVELILATARHTNLDLVAEGWLLLHLPDDLKQKLEKHTTPLYVTMRRYIAHVGNKKTIRPSGRDYSKVVSGLVKHIAFAKGISIMRGKVRYQSFEDIRDYQGSSDSAGKLLALALPADLSGKRILDVGCGTGYFSIRCWQRGAKVHGIDVRKNHVHTAARLANVVYRTREPHFEPADVFNYNPRDRYDYILAVTVLPCFGERLQEFFERAYDWLVPGGTLVVETPLPRRKSEHSRIVDPRTGVTLTYATEKSLCASARSFEVIYRGKSVRSRGSKRRRVYHFRKPGVVANASDALPEPLLHSGAAAPREEYADPSFPGFLVCGGSTNGSALLEVV